jgi:phosphoglycolate phosphatase
MFDAARGVLFDLDGTLIQQTIDFEQMRLDVLRVAERFGPVPAPFVTLPVLELIAHVVADLDAREAGAGSRFAQAAQEVVTAIELAASEGAAAYPGVPEFLLWLRRAGFRVAIVTRNCREAVEQALARSSLACDVLLTREDVARVKPDPEHLLVALRRMDVPAADAVMCGDHPMDVMAGRRAGTATVGILSGDLPADRFAEVHPDLVLSSVTGLRHYLPRQAPC